MAGTQTAGYDMVIQFSEDFYENIIGSNFDINNIVPQILERLHLDESLFSITVSLDRPTDISLEGSGENPIDISVDIGNNGSIGNLRIVVGAVMIRLDSEKDVLTIDFENSLYYAKATAVLIGEQDIKSIVKSLINPIPVMPIPVDRDSVDPKVANRADFKIIDDTSIENKNVLSTMLTFGGGSQGNHTQLDSFVDDSGAIGLFFGWLCRLIIPKLEESLDMPSNSFTNTGTECKFSGSIVIDDDEDIYLKKLSLKLVDGYIQFDARVSTDGFCYEATGDVRAKIKFVIEDGRLKVIAEVGDPDVDLDIPWYCYIGAAVIGALTGGALLGIIGAVVGVVLIPLITWIVAEIVEGTFDDIADSIRDSVNNNLPEVDMQAYGIEILFQDVFIDDVIMKTKAIIHEAFPIRAEGVLRLRLGQGIDLDRGIVSSVENALNDINWMGHGANKYLKTGCEAAIADTNRKRMNKIMHFQLNGYDYKTKQKISQSEFGRADREHWYSPFYNFIENKKVLAVRTNGGRYSMIQIVEVEENHGIPVENEFLAKSGDWVMLRYKTFEGAIPSVRIFGNFSCTKVLKDLDELSVEFISKNDLSIRNPVLLTNTNALSNVNAVKLKPSYRGDWLVKLENNSTAKANLRAVSSGIKGSPKYLWIVGNHALQDNTNGIVNIDGEDIEYEVKFDKLILSVKNRAKIEVLVNVNVIDDHGCSVSQARCITHDGKCIVAKRYIPNWKEYKLLNKQTASTVRDRFILRKTRT